MPSIEKEAFRMAKLGRWEYDHKMDELKWSDTIYDIFEICSSRFTPTYKGFLDIIHPEDTELVDKAWRKSLSDKKPYKINHRLLMKSGMVKWVIEYCETEFDEQGNPLKSVGIVQDITKQKKNEEILRREQELQGLLTRVATGLINAPLKNIDSVLFNTIESIGQFAEVDRVYLFEYDPSEQTMTNTHEWCAEGIHKQLDHLQSVPYKIYSDLKEYSGRETWHIPRVSDIPEQYEELRTHLEGQDIRSLLVVPLLHEENTIGFAGFDMVRQERVFSETEINLLKVFAQIITSVMARRGNELRISRALREKNILLSEIHHRIKNNLAVISGLLSLQSEFDIGQKDPESLIEEIQNRIKSMALVHEMVYENQSYASVHFGKLLRRLTSNLETIYRPKGYQISLDVSADETMVEMSRCIPLSLLANELILNAYKHAYNSLKRGRITVGFFQNNDGCELSVRDDGKGVEDIERLRNPETFGYTIIHGLAGQLQGSIDFPTREAGLEVSVRFPLDQPKSR